MLAHYHCWNCKHTWKEPPAGLRAMCPKCGHIYLDWLNWKEVVEWSEKLYREQN